jgi:hypothetical protein
MKRIIVIQSIAIAGFVMFLQSCAPVFSELQSARTVGKNKIEATPSYSSVSYSKDGKTEGVQNHMGVQLAYGISSKVDLRFRYEYIWLKKYGQSDVINVVGIGPKFSLVENKIAFAVPIGRAFGEGTEDSWEVHPTLLFTIPAVKDKLDINLAPKLLVPLCKGYDNLVAINLGISFSNNLSKWAIRPEYGILFNPGASGHYSQFSIGFSTTFGK